MRIKILVFVCLCAAAAGGCSASAYASQSGEAREASPGASAGSVPAAGGYSLEDLAEEFDEQEFEQELMKLLESGEGDGDITESLKEPFGESGDALEEIAQMKKITNPPLNMRWDKNAGMLVYGLPNQRSFSVSVPDGMMTTGPVVFQAQEKIRLTVWLDGMKLKPHEDGVYREAGNYQVKLLVLPNGNESGDNNLYEVDFFFRILSPRSSEVSLLKAPDGFAISLLEQDGRGIEPEHDQWHFLGQDGSYRVRFVDQSTKRMTFETSFIRDTKAPLLMFTPMPDRYAMTEAVHVDVDDPQAGIAMYYNGKPVQNALSLLEIGGYYQYRVKDGSGNERFYAVRMAERIQTPGPGVIITAFIGVGGAVAWFMYQRRHPRFL